MYLLLLLITSSIKDALAQWQLAAERDNANNAPRCLKTLQVELINGALGNSSSNTNTSSAAQGRPPIRCVTSHLLFI